MSADASKGKTALDNNDYQSAVKYLSAALKSSQAPLWLLQRSTAYHRLGKYHLALHDANNALLVAYNRGKRELIADAHYRRGIIYHGLKQYGNSRMCFHWCRKYNEKQRGLSMWISKIATDYDANGGEQAQCNEVTVKELPEKSEYDDQEDQSTQSSLENKNEDIETRKSDLANYKPSSKIRYEWYQSQSNVTVEILVKAVSKESTTVELQEKSLKISFPDPSSSSTCNFCFEPLYSKIELSKSSHRVTPHKIEVILHKSIPGLKWSTLQSSDPNSVETIVSYPETSNEVRDSKVDLKVPVYPTSSKTGPKNWDKLVGNEAEEDGEEGADAFFKMLYKNADPDTKRAMIKSYQESNGTSLSTQWSDVGNRKVETIPPDGLEAKRWDA